MCACMHGALSSAVSGEPLAQEWKTKRNVNRVLNATVF